LQEIGYAQTAETAIFSRWRTADPTIEDLDLLYVDSSTFAKLERDAIIAACGELEIRVPSVAGMVALKLHAMRNDPSRRIRDTQDIQELLRRNPQSMELADLRSLCETYGPDGIFETIRHPVE
jgi:hypothetical protein